MITWTTGAAVLLGVLVLGALAVLAIRALDRAEQQHKQINADELEPHPEGNDQT